MHGPEEGPVTEDMSMSDFEYSAYVGLDVHKDSIAVAIARPGRTGPEWQGTIPNHRSALRHLIKRLSPDGLVLSFCYEAGPCGSGLSREITETGHHCVVVAPGLVPRGATDRIKTDRRDATMLAREHRSGSLTPVWVPDPEQEAMRDLTRAREDMKALQTKARQRLGAFLLRHDRIYPGRSRWTQAHTRWLEAQAFDSPVQQIVFQEYVDAAREATRRVADLENQIHTAAQDGSLAPLVTALISLRGIHILSAVTILAELGDITRFDTPRQLMSFLGLVPSEHSSGPKRRTGGITKTGNGHVRRIRVEAAWNTRVPARKTRHLQAKAAAAPDRVQTIAWQAQKRLCARYSRLSAVRKHQCKVTTAVARELVGVIGAIVCEVNARPHASRALT